MNRRRSCELTLACRRRRQERSRAAAVEAARSNVARTHSLPDNGPVWNNSLMSADEVACRTTVTAIMTP